MAGVERLLHLLGLAAIIDDQSVPEAAGADIVILVGDDPAGGDIIDPHTLGSPLIGQPLAEAVHEALGCAVMHHLLRRLAQQAGIG